MKSLTVIVQGGLHPNEINLVKKFKQAFPFAQVVVSTWTRDEALAAVADDYIVSADPGGFALAREGKVIRTENINRQIVSTRAGLDVATGEWALKWRSDFDFDVKRMFEVLTRHAAQLPDDGLLTLSYHTANPFADVGLVGHVSDWMYFGRTAHLRKLVSPTPIPAVPEHTEVPDRDDRKVFPFASFSCEQLMLREGFQTCYGLPMTTFGDAATVSSFLRLVGKKIFIENPSALGTVTHKYDKFIYLSAKGITSYIWFKLACIGPLECTVNRSLGLRALTGWLRCKAFLSDGIETSKRALKAALCRWHQAREAD